MLKKLHSLTYALLFLLIITAATHGEQHDDRPIILVLGDSISAGYGLNEHQSWVSLLQKRLDSSRYHYRVINASISGDTSGGGRARLPKILAQHHPEIVILELGGNDGLRGHAIKNIRINLDAIVTLCKQNNSRVVLLGMQIPLNYGRSYTQKFAEIYSTLAEQHQLPWVPFFLDKVATNPELMQEDQIHPTAAAQRLLLDNVWPVLGTVLKK